MLVRLDDREYYGEDRWIGLGDLGGLVVVVVFTERGSLTRIISARKADRRERETYQEGLGRA
jgi:uncharacterized DUF497 family protein